MNWADRKLITFNGMDEVEKRESFTGSRVEKTMSFKQQSRKDTIIERNRPNDVTTYTEIPLKTKITYHQLYEFGKLYERNKLGINLLQNSFSPELN